PMNSPSKRSGPHLRWLPLDEKDPRNSFAYTRTGKDGESSTIFVLLATLVWRPKDGGAERPLYGGQGVRVLIRLRTDQPKLPPVLEAVAASSSLPATANVNAWTASVSDDDIRLMYAPSFAEDLPSVAGLDPSLYGTAAVGVRLSNSASRATSKPAVFLTARMIPGIVAPDASASGVPVDTPAYGVEAEMVSTGERSPPKLESLRRFPLFAMLKAQVYTKDPPTRDGSVVLARQRPAGVPRGRPNVSTGDLDKFRDPFDFGALPAAGPNRELLQDPKAMPRFFVAQSRHVEPGIVGYDENLPLAVPDNLNDPVRSDRFAAVNAYLRANDFFRRLDLYGLSLQRHFAFAQLPIVVRYRAGILPGAGDGRTVNAQVRWAPTMPPTAFPSRLEVRLALADLQSNEGCEPVARRAGDVRSPLSIAADTRWCWHEFGHVLIAGATASLELDFAHSVGDALAAILCDPTSALATEGSWRGVTFPWVSLPNRRHDLEPSDGWSWSGTMSRRRKSFAGRGGHHVLALGGYCSEQLMSSTLFRLYLSLGGETKLAGGPDTARREVAAEHTVALVMAAVGLLGYSGASMVKTVDDFVNTMFGADKDMPPLVINARTRYGGMAHKVIRWAFERQGAFKLAGGKPDAPGAPPAVDVFVAAKRPGTPGGYEPVDLAADLWHAATTALWIRRKPSGLSDQAPKGGKDNFVFVKVRNRGRFTAVATRVRVRVAQLTAAGQIPPWLDPAWAELYPTSASAGAPLDVAAGSPGRRFGPFRWPGAVAGVSYAILVEATTLADESNLDPAAGQKCASAPCDVGELVAFDNNLGLRIVTAVP
ncbi:MAG TPA: hypothetical protein VFO33_03890, partial [Casimicrobiaceae bacterium]|nr:hypothetical protein [Casimicrobiaceae bacterium]